MTRLLTAICLSLSLAACAPRQGPAGPSVAAVQSVTLSIVGTNDLHGGLLPRDGRGGLALLGGYLENLRAARARDGGAVLLIDAGDMFQGTLESNLTEGMPVVAAYNALGYAAAAVGNHEFDFGPVGPAATPRTAADDPRGALKARAAEARFPFLAANLLDTATGRPVRWPNIQPTAMVQAAGIKIGIIGVMTRVALTATTAANVRGLSLAPLPETIRAHAETLRAQGATVVIVAAHAGGRCTNFDRPEDLSSCDLSSEIFTAARAVPRGLVDVIVAGHSHAPIGHQVEGIAITEAFSGGRAFGRVDLTIDRRSKAVTATRSFAPRDLVAPAEYEHAAVVPDPAIERVIAPALDRVRALKARLVGIVLDTPIRRLTPVSPLGNLFTDALLASVPGAEVSLHNNGGGLRADLPQGPLTYGSVYEVMPFDNLVVTIRLTGRQLRRVFETRLLANRIPGFSGIRVHAQCAAGSLEVTLMRTSGDAIRDSDQVTVALTDFLATGGDGVLTAVMPEGGFPIDASGSLARDVFAEYLDRLEGPLREEPFLETAHPRLSLPGGLPVRCSG